MFLARNIFGGFWVVSLSLFSISRGTVLTVGTTGGNASSPLLYGIMFEVCKFFVFRFPLTNKYLGHQQLRFVISKENITSHFWALSGDGGIHGQVLKNNGFQGTSPNLTAYAAVGAVTLSQDKTEPLTSAITSSLKISTQANATGQVGFSNSGYNGVPVNADTYNNYFWVKGDYSGTVTVALVGTQNGETYGSQHIHVLSNDAEWKYYETSFTSVQSPDANNVWQLTFDSSKVRGGALWFDLVQLFPSTYHRRCVNSLGFHLEWSWLRQEKRPSKWRCELLGST